MFSYTYHRHRLIQSVYILTTPGNINYWLTFYTLVTNFKFMSKHEIHLIDGYWNGSKIHRLFVNYQHLLSQAGPEYQPLLIKSGDEVWPSCLCYYHHLYLSHCENCIITKSKTVLSCLVLMLHNCLRNMNTWYDDCLDVNRS